MSDTMAKQLCVLKSIFELAQDVFIHDSHVWCSVLKCQTWLWVLNIP